MLRSGWQRDGVLTSLVEAYSRLQCNFGDKSFPLLDCVSGDLEVVRFLIGELAELLAGDHVGVFLIAAEGCSRVVCALLNKLAGPNLLVDVALFQVTFLEMLMDRTCSS